MAGVLRSKRWLKWDVNIPSKHGSSVRCEVFIQGHRCFFEFITGYSYQSSTTLRLRSYRKLEKAVKVTVIIPELENSLLESKSFQGDTVTWENLLWSIMGDTTFHFLIDDNDLGGDKCIQTASYLNTEVSVEDFTKDMSQLLDSEKNHDVEIKSGDHSVKAHKIVLCARSDVFKAILESDMIEGLTGIIEMKDIDINYIKDLLKYLYTGAMPELSLDEAIALYEIGDKYAIRSLTMRCREYLQDNLSPENVFQCFVFADTHSDQELKDSIKTFILNKKVHMEDKYWLPFCKNYPEMAIEIYRLSYKNVSEAKR